MRFLNVSGNRLAALPEGIFSGLRSLEGVDVSGQEDAAGNAIASLPLNVTLQESTVGMVVIEVAQGVPFTTVIANVSISGGTFSDTSSTTTTVTLSKGDTRNSSIGFTVAAPTPATPMPEATISIDSTSSTPGDPFSNRMGYSGFTLASGPALTRQMGICSRTRQVQTEILRLIPLDGVTEVTCDRVTDAQLAAISGTLALRNSGLMALRSGDFAGLTNLTILDLSANQLGELPANLFDTLTSLTRLDLDENELSDLRSEVFDALTALRGLDLSDNQLSGFRPGLFDALTSLTWLDLENNALTELDAALFTGLTALEILDLDGNALEGLPAALFTGLTKLTALSLIDNALTELDADIFADLTALTTLSLNDNALTTLDADIFAGLTNLTTLVLLNNALTTLDADLFNPLTNLTLLNLGNNALTELSPRIFTALTNLTGLNLNNNALTELPSGIFSGLTRLTAVLVDGNSIDPLPLNVTIQEISQGSVAVEVAQGIPFTTVIANVSISGGTFSDTSSTTTTVTLSKGDTRSSPIEFTVAASTTAMPEATVTIDSTNSTPENILTGFDTSTEMGYSGFTLASGDDLVRQMGICSRTEQVQTEVLRLLAMNGAMCDEVTEDQLAGITTLNLGNQNIPSLKSGDFADFTALTTLSLNDNALTELPSSIFSSLIALTELDLSENALTTLDAGIFSSLTNLTELSLSNNDLTTLATGIFSSLTTLRTLSLNDNDLTELPPRIFSGLTNLTGVQVDGQTTESLPLNVIIQEMNNEMAVVEVVQGVPFTSVTATLSITGGTFADETQTIDVMIAKGETQSAPFRFTSIAATIRITSISSAPENILTDFDTLTEIGYSGFTLISGGPLSFGVEERIEEAGASILPMIGRELISGIQSVVSGRIGRLTPNPAIVLPTAQVAGQSTLSELLVFGAQTFDKVHNQKRPSLSKVCCKKHRSLYRSTEKNSTQ